MSVEFLGVGIPYHQRGKCKLFYFQTEFSKLLLLSFQSSFLIFPHVKTTQKEKDDEGTSMSLNKEETVYGLCFGLKIVYDKTNRHRGPINE